VGFTAKIITGYQLRETFLQRGNSKTYLNAIAFNLVLNHEYQIQKDIPSVDYEPLYPWLMNVAYSMSGPNWLALTIMQALLHLLTSFLIFKTCSALWNPVAGCMAGIYHSFYPYLFTYSLSVYDTTLFVFLLVTATYFILANNHKLFHFIIAGIVIGLAFLTRATIITFLPPFILFILYAFTKKSGIKNALTRIGVLMLACIITLAPWLIRNYGLTGKILISTHGAFGLWQGNNDLSEFYLKNNISLDEIYRRTPPPEIYTKFPLTSRTPADAIIAADNYKEETKNWIKENPKTFVRIAFLKAQKLWTWNRNPKSSNPKFGSNEGRQYVNLIAYLPLLFCFPFGFWFLFKKNKAIALTILCILICFTAAHMVAMGFTRARIPIDFLLMIFAGIALSEFLEMFMLKKVTTPKNG
jgi:4-amino-4-deoxy-L-arabinose transferase-like glycosyltransferase